jgi:uncharacterized membrane protein
MMVAGDLLCVLAASYDDVGDARADFDAVQSLYDEIKAPHEFDAAVLVRNEKGKVKIDKTHGSSTRHEALQGLGWGMAAGTATAIFPAIGIWGGIAAGGGSGAAIGAIAGHVKSGMNRGELKQLGDIVERGQAALIVVYRENVAVQVAALIKPESRFVGYVLDATSDQIAEDVREAEACVPSISLSEANRLTILTAMNVDAALSRETIQ